MPSNIVDGSGVSVGGGTVWTVIAERALALADGFEIL